LCGADGVVTPFKLGHVDRGTVVAGLLILADGKGDRVCLRYSGDSKAERNIQRSHLNFGVCIHPKQVRCGCGGVKRHHELIPVPGGLRHARRFGQYRRLIPDKALSHRRRNVDAPRASTGGGGVLDNDSVGVGGRCVELVDQDKRTLRRHVERRGIRGPAEADEVRAAGCVGDFKSHCVATPLQPHQPKQSQPQPPCPSTT